MKPLQRGMRHLKRGEYAEAVEALEKAKGRARDPHLLEAYMGLGRERLKLHEFASAVEALEKASKLSRAREGLDPEPYLGFAYRGLGEKLLQEGEARGAKEALEKAWMKGVEDPMLHFRLGEAHAALGNAPNAARHYDNAVRGFSGSAPRDELKARMSLAGIHLFHYGEPEKALGHLEDIFHSIQHDKGYRIIRRFRPLLAELNYLKGIAHMDGGDADNALRSFNAAVNIHKKRAEEGKMHETDPSLVNTLNLRGTVHGMRGARFRGEGKLGAAETAHRHALDDFREARRLDRHDLAAAAGLSTAHNRLGDIAEERGEPKRADRHQRRAFRRAVSGLRADPGDPDMLERLTASAAAIMRLGRGGSESYERLADKYQKKALEENPGEPRVWFLRAMLERERRNPGDFVRNMKRYFEADAAGTPPGELYVPPQEAFEMLKEAVSEGDALGILDRINKKRRRPGAR